MGTFVQLPKEQFAVAVTLTADAAYCDAHVTVAVAPSRLSGLYVTAAFATVKVGQSSEAEVL